MPRKAKDKDEVIEKKKTKAKTASKSTKTAAKTTKTTSKKTTAKKTTATKKVAAKKPTTKKATTKKTAVKKTTTKKTTTKKTTAKKTTAKKTTTKKVVAKKEELKREEYYDLPYRYNETKVKVLAQTPNILFVYWDISDEDRTRFIKEYGDFFFNDTKPVLVIHNDTMNYTFEVDINDFANSWYLHVNDSNCDYRVELGRRPINEYAKINDYMPVTYSNDIDSPNDRILFESIDDSVYFRNVKTNEKIKIDLTQAFLEKLGRLYNIKEFYKAMYKDENIDFERLNLKNMPSS